MYSSSFFCKGMVCLSPTSIPLQEHLHWVPCIRIPQECFHLPSIQIPSKQECLIELERQRLSVTPSRSVPLACLAWPSFLCLDPSRTPSWDLSPRPSSASKPSSSANRSRNPPWSHCPSRARYTDARWWRGGSVPLQLSKTYTTICTSSSSLGWSSLKLSIQIIFPFFVTL